MRWWPLVALLLGSVLVEPAFAGKPKGGGGAAAADASPKQRALMAVAQSERDEVEAIVGALTAIQDEKGEVNVSDAAKAHWKTAKALHAEATALWQAQNYRDAYMKFRDAVIELEPVMGEILDKPNLPQPLVDAIAREMEETSKRIDTLAEVIGPHVDDAEAKAAYADAKSLHAEAKSLWNDPGNGHRKEATLKLWEATKKLDVAIRKAWAS